MEQVVFGSAKAPNRLLHHRSVSVDLNLLSDNYSKIGCDFRRLDCFHKLTTFPRQINWYPATHQESVTITSIVLWILG